MEQYYPSWFNPGHEWDIIDRPVFEQPVYWPKTGEVGPYCDGGPWPDEAE